MRKAKTDYHLQRFTSSSYNPSKFWKTVKSTCNRLSSSLSARINIGPHQITDNCEFCTAFNNHFAASGHLFDKLVVPSGSLEEHDSSLSNTGERVNRTFSLSPVSRKMVADVLCNIDPKTSTGNYKLDTFALKSSAHLTANLSITSGIIPMVWKSVCLSSPQKW